VKLVWAALIAAAVIVIVGAIAIFEFGSAVLKAAAEPARGNAYPARSEFHHTYDLPASGAVSIDDAKGSIRVAGWNKHSVQVDAVLLAPTAQDLTNLSVSVDQHADAVDISTNFPSWSSTPWWRLLGGQGSWEDLSPHVDYIVRVPSGVRVRTHGVSADAWLSGLAGALRAESISGDVTASDIGNAVMETTSGTVSITRARGTIEATTISGDILFRDATGDLAANSTSGEVQLYTDSGKVAATTTSGDVTARSFSGIGRLSSTSGDVSLTLRRIGNIPASASSVSGNIQSDAPLQTGAPIELRTVSGDISVHYSQ
jgi:hypothetical protein